MSARTLIAAAGMLFGCAACGFKGPLYLPQHDGAVVTHPANNTPATASPAAAQRKSSRTQGNGSGTPPP